MLNVPDFGRIGHEKDIQFHLFCGIISHTMRKQHKSQWASIFADKTANCIYSVDEVRKQVKKYIRLSEGL